MRSEIAPSLKKLVRSPTNDDDKQFQSECTENQWEALARSLSLLLSRLSHREEHGLSLSERVCRYIFPGISFCILCFASFQSDPRV